MTEPDNRVAAARRPDTPDPRSPRRQLLWPGMILGLLGSQMLLLLVMVYLATSDRSFAVEPDYYQKALHWDESVARDRSGKRLGWSARIEVGDAADVLKRRELACTLQDASGAPLRNARVEIVAFSHARGQERTLAALAEIGAGIYATSVRIPRTGLWEFRVTVHRESDRFTQVVRQQVKPPGATLPWRH